MIFDSREKGTKPASELKEASEPYAKGEVVSTQLEEAVLSEDSELVEELLSSNVPCTGKMKDGRYLLHAASESRDTRIALMLLRCGANPDAVAENGERPIDVLLRNEFIAEDMLDVPYDNVQIARTIDAVRKAYHVAEMKYVRGLELMELRAKLLADNKIDQERAIRMASMHSMEITGSRRTGPSEAALAIPYEERTSHPLWRNLWLKGEANSPPGWEHTFEAKPLPKDLLEPLELPIPSQFEEGTLIVQWCVIRAALVYNTSSEEFQTFLKKANQLIDATNSAVKGAESHR